MGLQSKLITTYSAFIILLIVVISLCFFYYNVRDFEKKAYGSITDLSKQISQQLENIIRPMDYISIDILSRTDFMSAAATLAYMDRNDTENTNFINESITTIKDSINRDSIVRTVYRVSVFNTKGDFYTSNYKVESDGSGIPEKINSLEWLEKAFKKDGHMYLAPPHKDFWAATQQAEVYSIVRLIRGPYGGKGFLEVQNTSDILFEIFSVGIGKDIGLLAINDDNDVIYSNRTLEPEMLRYYLRFADGKSNMTAIQENPMTGSMECISYMYSDYTGCTVIAMQNREDMLASLLFIRNMTIGISTLFISLSLVFIYIFSRQLTKPIKQLKSIMEEVGIENLSDKLPIENSNNEIEALNRSFQRMRERLNKAIQDEIKSRSLQLRANFDSLQSQINPHFLYNILNVISGKGLAVGEREICEICDAISDMLRYSTSTKSRFVKIRDEVDYVTNYLNLMKKRFEHKLEFDIKIDERIMDVKIPKLILQPLVENSIYHGFNKSAKVMRIVIRGFAIENEWRMHVADNGDGFGDEVLKNLESRMQDFEKEISGIDDYTGLAIGGIGVVSTYARMSLFYNGQFRFELGNNSDGGACTVIGGALFG